MEISNEKNRSPFIPLLLAMLVPAVLGGVLVLVRAALPPTAATAILVLSYACSLLSLFATMVGLGAALFYLSRKQAGMACRMVWLTEGVTLLPLLVAAVRTAIDYPADLATALTIEILSALGNTLLMAALHFLLLLLCWALFFRKGSAIGTPRLSPVRNRLGLASLTVVGALFLYQAVAETVEAVNFISTYWPNVYRNEIASIVFTYVYLVVTLFLGYAIQYGAQTYLHHAYEE